jgi:hypothetical protein
MDLACAGDNRQLIVGAIICAIVLWIIALRRDE